MLHLAEHTWSVDANKFDQAYVATDLELGEFPGLMDITLTYWDAKQTILGSGFNAESQSVYLPSKPFAWNVNGKKSTFTGISGEFTIDRNGMFLMSKSAIDSQLSTELHQRGVKASGTVSQTEIVISCLARRRSEGNNGLTPQAVAITLDYLRGMQLDPEYKAVLPTIINYCLTEQ